MKALATALTCVALGMAPAAGAGKNRSQQRSLTVTATAFNASAAQTDGQPHVGAWGDRLDNLGPGVRAVAISPDLLAKGLKRKQRIRIDGFKGEFLVLDRTHARWQNRIDIFMGGDAAAARKFGKKPVKIHWSEPAAASP